MLKRESMTVLLLEFAPAGFKDSQRIEKVKRTVSIKHIVALTAQCTKKHMDTDKTCSVSEKNAATREKIISHSKQFM